MEKQNITTTCRRAAESRQPERKGWGFSFMADDELDAMRIAYAYRNSPHGVKVEHCPAVSRYMVTVWNDRAQAMGCDV